MKNNNLLSVAFASLLLFSQVLAWDNSCSNCNTNQRLRVATWSANQTPGYTTNNAERLEGSLSYLAGSSVAALNLNLVCLQEVYNTSDRQAIINGLSGAFPYNFGAAAGTQGSCDPSNTNCNLFGGNSGTLILSTLPIEASQVLTFQTQAQTNSNALWVKVTWNGVPVNFVCTDLLPDDYSASGLNYEALNMAQTQELLGWLNTNVPNNQPVILTGDFGSGPAVGSNSGVFVNNYNLITGAGYQNAFLQLVPAADVPSTNGQNSVTSHVFIKTNTNPAGCVSSVGAFGRDITVVTSTGETVPISDSTGIWAGVCYGNQVVQPTSAPIQTAVPIVVQPVQVISSGVAVIPFMAVVAALLALVF